MSRQANKEMTHVYDSESDMWFGPFDSEEQITEFIDAASNASQPGNEVTEDRAPSNLMAFSVPLPSTGTQPQAVCVLPYDPDRAKCRIKISGLTAGAVFVGTKASTNGSAPNGYRLDVNGETVAVDAQSEVWAVLQAGSTVAATGAFLSIIGSTLLP